MDYRFFFATEHSPRSGEIAMGVLSRDSDWLVDGDIANNQMNWQWVTSTGTGGSTS